MGELEGDGEELTLTMTDLLIRDLLSSIWSVLRKQCLLPQNESSKGQENLDENEMPTGQEN
jgi:hypothetical protein